MNFTKNDIFTDSFMACINGMTARQLNEAQAVLERKLAVKAQQHMTAIQAAIEAAKADGFNILIGHEGDLDNLFIITQDDEEGFDVEVH